MSVSAGSSPLGLTLACFFLRKARVGRVGAGSPLPQPHDQGIRGGKSLAMAAAPMAGSPFCNPFLSWGFTSPCPGSTSCFLQIQLRQLLAHHVKFPGALEPLDSLGPTVGRSQASRQG